MSQLWISVFGGLLGLLVGLILGSLFATLVLAPGDFSAADRVQLGIAVAFIMSVVGCVSGVTIARTIALRHRWSRIIKRRTNARQRRD